MMWSEVGLERLRGAVVARLRAVLELDCPPLEPGVRTVLGQRLDLAALDLMELIRRGEDTGAQIQIPVVNVKSEQIQVKEEPETPELKIVCVKMEPEEQEIQTRPEPPSVRTRQVQTQDDNLDLHQAEIFQYCPQCGSTRGGARDLRSPLSLLPIRAQSQCSFCGQSSGCDVLLLEHNYTQDLQSSRALLERNTAGFRCSVCGQDFSQVEALLEHMSQHLHQNATVGLGFDYVDSEAWSFEDDAFDEESLETICSVCGYVCTDSEQLQEHLRTHLR